MPWVSGADAFCAGAARAQVAIQAVTNFESREARFIRGSAGASTYCYSQVYRCCSMPLEGGKDFEALPILSFALDESSPLPRQMSSAMRSCREVSGWKSSAAELRRASRLRLLLHGKSGLGILLLVGEFNLDGLAILRNCHAADADYFPVPLVGFLNRGVADPLQ